uniref:Uncharacterized protein n=2 Tax=Panthera TaxID=9688 RepID=A0A8C9CZ01_PANLE
MNLTGHAQLNSGPLSQKKPSAAHFKCYCFCLLMLETQTMQFVQLENLVFFLGSPQKYNRTETCYALIKRH